MSGEISSKTSLVPSRFDVAVFDLDGVVTDTARVHFQAWKETFDTFFEMRGRHEGTGFAPFTADD
jgi:beta-phosphoglucomutase-like phosphatase (HAD superfamily)